MTVFRSAARKAAYAEAMAASRAAFAAGDLDTSFGLAERAHILGQPWVIPHTAAHWRMLRIGIARRDAREIRGQLLRLAAGGLLSAIGVLPEGNTGGADVPPEKPMPLPDDLAAICRT